MNKEVGGSAYTSRASAFILTPEYSRHHLSLVTLCVAGYTGRECGSIEFSEDG